MILSANAEHFPAIFSRRAYLSCERHSPFDEIDHRQPGKRAVGILRQTAIARLGETANALRGVEPMFNLGADRRLAPVGLFVRFGQGPVTVGALVGEVPSFRRMTPAK